MAKIKTAGDLRTFLADVLIDIRNGAIDADQASAISKVAAQINNSLAVEVNTALRLASMGKDHPVAGSMAIGGPDTFQTSPIGIAADGTVWCEQCEALVKEEDAKLCKSRHCSVRGKFDAQP